MLVLAVWCVYGECVGIGGDTEYTDVGISVEYVGVVGGGIV